MTRSAAVRISALALALGALAAITLPGNGIGVNMPLLVLVLAAAGAAAAGEAGLRRVDRADAWLAPAAIAFAAMTALRTDPWLVTLDVLVAATLVTAAIATLGGARVTRGAAADVAASAIAAMLVPLAGAVVVIAAALRGPSLNATADATSDEPAVRRRLAIPPRAVPVLRGVAIALPLVVLFTALFASADAVFGRIAASLLDWHLSFNIEVLTVQGFVMVFVAWGSAGLLALGANALPSLIGRGAPAEPVRWSNGQAIAPAALAPAARLIGPVEATTVLVVLDALFVLFVALQVAYLFGGRDTLAASGLTYADYARRGFFELVVAAGIAGLIAVGLDRLVGQRSRAQLIASAGLLVLTLVILASALARLRLYQDAYGWTELRFFVLASIGWLAAAVLGTALLLIRDQARLTLHLLAVLALAVLGVMNGVGPESYVAQQNLERAANPALVPPGGKTGLDLGYFGSLGDDAVPVALAALPSLRPDDRAGVEDMLAQRRESLGWEMAGTGWPSWSLSRERAREALDRWYAGN